VRDDRKMEVVKKEEEERCGMCSGIQPAYILTHMGIPF